MALTDAPSGSWPRCVARRTFRAPPCLPLYPHGVACASGASPDWTPPVVVLGHQTRTTASDKALFDALSEHFRVEKVWLETCTCEARVWLCWVPLPSSRNAGLVSDSVRHSPHGVPGRTDFHLPFAPGGWRCAGLVGRQCPPVCVVVVFPPRCIVCCLCVKEGDGVADIVVGLRGCKVSNITKTELSL